MYILCNHIPLCAHRNIQSHKAPNIQYQHQKFSVDRLFEACAQGVLTEDYFICVHFEMKVHEEQKKERAKQTEQHEFTFWKCQIKCFRTLKR